jgi:multidrug resistance protein MdtO
MAPASDSFIDRFGPGERAPTDFFSDLREFCSFLWAELRPYPGRASATVRLVVAVVTSVIVSETLRVPDPDFSAYLIFFVANEDGVSSIKAGLLAMVGITIGLAAGIWVSICFTDAPWFRLPVTLFLIGGSVWLSRTLVLAVMGRLLAVVLALYLSLADVIFDAETLTESVLWLWSVVGIAVGVSVLTSLIIEPRPDLLLRAEIEDNIGAVRALLESISHGRLDLIDQAKALRRRLYGGPARMRQLLMRWRQSGWPARSDTVYWDLAIFVVERLLASAAAVVKTEDLSLGPESRKVLAELQLALGQLIQAVRERNPDLVKALSLPSADNLPESTAKAAFVELISALEETRWILQPPRNAGEETSNKTSETPRRSPLVQDALTNPDYLHFALKTTLAIAACEIFLNAVAWPGIRTAMVTCAATALATVGAQRQKQLLRLTGVCVGGLMGLVAVIYVIPQLDSIVGLSLLVAAGTACCGWVAVGSVRSSYAGFQMALAFFIVLLPGFDTSIDLTAIRDRFVGIVVGIMAMWVFFDHLWYTSSRRQLVDRLISILRLMSRARNVVTPSLSPAEARRRANEFRRELYGELNTGRMLLDETKIEMTLTFTRGTVRGSQLEVMATEVSFAAFVFLGLNERKLRALAAARLNAVSTPVGGTEEMLSDGFLALADAFDAFTRSLSSDEERRNLPIIVPRIEPFDPSRMEDQPAVREWQTFYKALEGCLGRINRMNWVVQGLR